MRSLRLAPAPVVRINAPRAIASFTIPFDFGRIVLSMLSTADHPTRIGSLGDLLASLNIAPAEAFLAASENIIATALQVASPNLRVDVVVFDDVTGYRGSLNTIIYGEYYGL